MARRATFLDGVWNENKPTLMLDGGDLFGNRNKNEKHQTEFLAAITGELGYDGIGLGERDLNYGLPFLLEMIEKHNLQFTNANVRDGATGKLILPEFLIVERRGIKYGVVSVLDPGQRIITMTNDDPVFEIADPDETLKELLPRMRKAVDNVVLVGHLGETLTETVIKSNPGIDMAVMGHTHRNINSERVIGQTAVFGSAFEGRYIGRANLFIDKNNGMVMGIDVGITSLDEAIADDEATFERVEQYKKDQLEFKSTKRAEYPRNLGSDKETFLGERACMNCHKDAWEAYVNTGHRRAFSTIRNKGQSFEPECLSCHTTGYQYQNGYSEERPYNKLTSVQCEACHGYGTQHARDDKWALQAKDSCVLCHDQENSPDFDYATYWEKIKH